MEFIEGRWYRYAGRDKKRSQLLDGSWHQFIENNDGLYTFGNIRIHYTSISAQDHQFIVSSSMPFSVGRIYTYEGPYRSHPLYHNCSVYLGTNKFLSTSNNTVFTIPYPAGFNGLIEVEAFSIDETTVETRNGIKKYRAGKIDYSTEKELCKREKLQDSLNKRKTDPFAEVTMSSIDEERMKAFWGMALYEHPADRNNNPYGDHPLAGVPCKCNITCGKLESEVTADTIAYTIKKSYKLGPSDDDIFAYCARIVEAEAKTKRLTDIDWKKELQYYAEEKSSKE